MCIIKETKDICLFMKLYITLDYILFTDSPYVSSIQSRSINSHVQYYGCNIYEVCLFPSKLEGWFKLVVHLVVSKYEILDSGFALDVHTHLQIGV